MAFQNSKQVSLDLDSILLPKSNLNILKDVSKVDDLFDKRSILNLHLKSLNEEMGKVKLVKSQLPYCMDLLRDAFERLSEELKAIDRLIGESKVTNEDGVGVSNDEKKKWMKSFQLWNTTNNLEANAQDSFLNQRSGCEVEKGSGSGSGSNLLGCNLKSGGGAFVPFKKPSDGVALKTEKRVAPVQGLSFQVPVVEVEQRSVDLNVHEERRVARRRMHEPEDQPRKMRRCWSPELHQLFVDAFNQLGGAEKATPKQIRELMNVEGLTNDEVKSHLQKYRIHIRRLRAGSASLSWPSDTQGPVAYSGSPQDHMKPGGSAVDTSSGSMEDEDDEKCESRMSLTAQNHCQYRPI